MTYKWRQIGGSWHTSGGKSAAHDIQVEANRRLMAYKWRQIDGSWHTSEGKSAAHGIQVEANRHEMLSVHLHFRQLKFAHKKRQVLKVTSHVALALPVLEKLKFQIFYLEKVGKRYLVSLLQWYNSFPNIRIFKSRSMHFCDNIHRFRDINILRFDLQKVGQSHGV